MKISYDSHADALSITFKEGKVKKTLELSPEILLDIDETSSPLYLEFIGAKEKLGKTNAEKITVQNLIIDKRNADTLVPA